MAAEYDDPHAPYELYQGEKLIGTFVTRAEARRRHQQLESQQATGPLVIKDNLGRIVL
jgi:hypothetical protein